MVSETIAVAGVTVSAAGRVTPPDVAEIKASKESGKSRQGSRGTPDATGRNQRRPGERILWSRDSVLRNRVIHEPFL
jgi:hypothetical protein